MAKIAALLPCTVTAMVALLTWLLPPGLLLAQEAQLELAIKATYLTKLSPFVEWPTTTPAFPADVFPICVVGHDPFGTLLDRAVSGQTVQGRPIVVRRYETLARNPGCAVMYVTGSDPNSAAMIIAEMRGQPVLTVTDETFKPKANGIINFVVRDNRVRFEIDDAAAAESGLSISSKLLSLAVFVRPRPSPGTGPR